MLSRFPQLLKRFMHLCIVCLIDVPAFTNVSLIIIAELLSASWLFFYPNKAQCA